MKSAESALDIECCGTVSCVEFSPFHWSNSLLAFCTTGHLEGTNNDCRITVGTYDLSKDGKSGKFNLMKEFNYNTSISCLKWSPQTCIETLPFAVVLCAGSLDGKVTLITSNLKEDNTILILGSHNGCVNSVCFDRDNGEIVASVGDDFKCTLWSKAGNKIIDFPLKSPGMDVQFHNDDNTKLAVGEKIGTIRFYDLITRTAFMSVDCCNSPLKSIGWNSMDITSIHALVGYQWTVFDTSKSSHPTTRIPVCGSEDVVRCGSSLRLSSSGNLVAIGCGQGNTVRIFSSLRGDKVLAHVSSVTGSGVCWHHSLPLLAVGAANRIQLLLLDQL